MVKQLLKSVREFKKDALLTPFFVVLEVVMEVLIPFVMAELIDKGIDAQNMSVIGKYGFILVACAMLALVFGAAAGTYAARASTGFALIGNADTGHIGRGDIRRRKHFKHSRVLRRPDLHRILLNPSFMRIMLRQLVLTDCKNILFAVKKYCS